MGGEVPKKILENFYFIVELDNGCLPEYGNITADGRRLRLEKFSP